MSRVDELYGEQIPFTTESDLLDRIANANTLKSINALRMAAVKSMQQNPQILKTWQDKFWSLKKCPTCGKVR